MEEGSVGVNVCLHTKRLLYVKPGPKLSSHHTPISPSLQMPSAPRPETIRHLIGELVSSVSLAGKSVTVVISDEKGNITTLATNSAEHAKLVTRPEPFTVERKNEHATKLKEMDRLRGELQRSREKLTEEGAEDQDVLRLEGDVERCARTLTLSSSRLHTHDIRQSLLVSILTCLLGVNREPCVLEFARKSGGLISEEVVLSGGGAKKKSKSASASTTVLSISDEVAATLPPFLNEGTLLRSKESSPLRALWDRETGLNSSNPPSIDELEDILGDLLERFRQGTFLMYDRPTEIEWKKKRDTWTGASCSLLFDPASKKFMSGSKMVAIPFLIMSECLSLAQLSFFYPASGGSGSGSGSGSSGGGGGSVGNRAPFILSAPVSKSKVARGKGLNKDE